MRIFYTTDISGSTIILPKDESRHLVQVLRLKQGNRVLVTKGDGKWLTCILVDDNPKKCQLEVESEQAVGTERNYSLHMAVAPTKNMQRFEFFVEKAVEIGVDRITPIITEHTERKVLKRERIERIAIAAIKQSRKAFLPKIDEAIALKDFLKEDFGDTLKMVAHCGAGTKYRVQHFMDQSSQFLIAIGPEGDFSNKEIQQMLNQGFNGLDLGKSRLRTETAAIAACHSVNLLHVK